MPIEIIATGLNLGEGPREADNGDLYFTDVLGDGLYRYSDGSGVVSIDPVSRNVGGVVLNADGSVIYSTRSGFKVYDPSTGTCHILPVHMDGAPFTLSVNDIEAGPNGAIYAGTIDHEGFENGVTPKPGFLFRVDPDGNATRLVEVGLPNGMDFTSAGRMIVSESGEGVFSYAVMADGSIGDRRLIVAMPDSDGIVLDEADGLWVARYMTNRVEYYDADGNFQRSIEVPYAAAASVALGGKDRSQLYVTGGDIVEKGKGGVIRLPVEIRGKKPYYSNINLA